VSASVEQWVEAALELRLFVESGSSRSSRLALVSAGEQGGAAGGKSKSATGLSSVTRETGGGNTSMESSSGADGRLLVCTATVPLRQLLLGDCASWLACLDWVATDEATAWLREDAE